MKFVRLLWSHRYVSRAIVTVGCWGLLLGWLAGCAETSAIAQQSLAEPGYQLGPEDVVMGRMSI
ncbi:MAG: hypothetical protein U0361_02830 [Nitrospiraceae bacterium]